jgi:hypothetical protein
VFEIRASVILVTAVTIVTMSPSSSVGVGSHGTIIPGIVIVFNFGRMNRFFSAPNVQTALGPQPTLYC